MQHKLQKPSRNPQKTHKIQKTIFEGDTSLMWAPLSFPY
jgi:hypothetical protein